MVHGSRLRHLLHDDAIFADGHFFVPGRMGGIVTDGPADKPAHIACIEFPGWALNLCFFWAVTHIPAVAVFRRGMIFFRQQKNQLALHVAWYCPPALFVAADSLQGDTKKAGQLFLGPGEFFSGFDKFFAVHIV